MNPSEARRVEDATQGELMRWHLCSTTWRGIWPELAERPGAPVQIERRAGDDQAAGQGA